MIDWDAHAKMLTAASEAAVTAFFTEHDNTPLAAIGYWMCVGIGYVSPPPFAITANPRHFYEAELAKSKATNPNFSDVQMRWDSGYFQYPACIELDPDVAEMATMLNDLVGTGEVPGEEISAGIINICCVAMAELAGKGLFGDPAKIDFVVQTANDGWYENEMQHVRDRDAAIRAMIGP